jgi:serine protease Do
MLSEFLQTEGKRPLLGLFIERRKDEKGAYLSVNRVIPGSPAERYGIRVGDRVIEINNKKIKEGVKLNNLFKQVAEEDTAHFRIGRGPEFYTVDISIKDMQEYIPSPVAETLCGMRLSDIRGYARLKYKVREKTGVVVTRVYKGGIAERYGLRPGDVILKINNGETADKEQFQELMVEGLRRNHILYQVKRNENIFLLPIKLDVLL